VYDDSIPFRIVAGCSTVITENNFSCKIISMRYGLMLAAYVGEIFVATTVAINQISMILTMQGNDIIP